MFPSHIYCRTSLFGLRILALAVCAAVCVLLAPQTASSQELALEFVPSAPFTIGSNVSAGWAFTTDQSVKVTSLDAYDPSGTGDVRLYNASNTILASATVTNADTIEGSPTPFFSQAISPVTLAANTTYYISEDMVANGTTLQAGVIPVTTNLGITFDGEVTAAGLGQDPTIDNLFGGSANPGLFGPNLDIQPVTPEPGALALVSSLAVSGIGFAIKRRLTRIKS